MDDPDVLVVQGGSTTFNPTLDPKIIARAEREDPEAAAAEWHGQFRDDIASFVNRLAVEACIDADVFERPFVYGNRYYAFVDPSGGSVDSMTLAVADRECLDGVEVAKLDVIREVKPRHSRSETAIFTAASRGPVLANSKRISGSLRLRRSL